VPDWAVAISLAALELIKRIRFREMPRVEIDGTTSALSSVTPNCGSTHCSCTMPFESVPAEESAGQGQKRLVYVCPLFSGHAGDETDSARRRSVQPPSAIGPIHCHAQCYASRAKA
jgi:hypothetical protein